MSQVLTAFSGRDDLTIITNSIGIAMAAAEQGQDRVLVAGGVLRPNSLELVGSLTESTLRVVHIETAFVGVDGVSAAGGITSHDDVEARTSLALMTRARRVVAVADWSKVGKVTRVEVCGIKTVDVLVTDKAAPADEISRIRAAGVDVKLV